MNEHQTTTMQRAKMVLGTIRNPTIRPCESEKILYLEYDGEALCIDCVKANKSLRHQLIHGTSSMDRVAFVGTHKEGPPEYCCNCDREIEATYGDPQEGEQKQS